MVLNFQKKGGTKMKKIFYVIFFVVVAVLCISFRFFFIPNLTISQDIDALSLWLEIYGGIVSIFMAIAFINIFTSKKEFDDLKKELENKSIELDNNYSIKIKEIDIISQQQNDKLVKFDEIINSKTNFIMNYTKYLIKDGENNLELIELFEKDLLNNKSQEIYEILTNLYINEIDKKLGFSDKTVKTTFNRKENNGKIDMDLFKKGINHLNEWLICRVDNDDFDFGLFLPISRLMGHMEIIIKQKNDFHIYLETNTRTKLEEIRKNFMQVIKITDYKNSNITPEMGNFIFYTFFLEQLIDLQICYDIPGSNALINQLMDLLEINNSLIILSEKQNNNNKSKDEKKDEPTDLSESKKHKDYMDEKKRKYNIL